MADDTVFLSAFLAGLISFFSPCIFPLLPLYFSIIVPDEEKPPGRWLVLTSAISFILGFTLVFILLGMTASALGSLMMAHQTILRKIGGGFMVLMGVFQMGIISSNFLMRDWRPFLGNATYKEGSGAFLLGMAFVFGWIPCTGPVLASILMYAGVKQSVYYGAGLLVAYSIGFSIPLLFIAVLTENFAKKFKNIILPHLEKIQKLAGFILIIVGLLLYLDYLTIIIRMFS